MEKAIKIQHVQKVKNAKYCKVLRKVSWVLLKHQKSSKNKTNPAHLIHFESSRHHSWFGSSYHTWRREVINCIQKYDMLPFRASKSTDPSSTCIFIDCLQNMNCFQKVNIITELKNSMAWVGIMHVGMICMLCCCMRSGCCSASACSQSQHAD